MTQRGPGSLVFTTIAQLNKHTERQFILNIGQLQVRDLYPDVEQQVDKDRLSLLPWRTEPAPWVGIEQRLALAARRNDLGSVTGLLVELDDKYQLASELIVANGIEGSLPPLAGLLIKALIAAASNGHIELVQLLLQLGAGEQPPGYRRFPVGNALIGAAKGNHLEVAELLLNHCQNTSTETSIGAVPSSIPGILRAPFPVALSASGANAPALVAAVKGGNVDMVRLLLQHGVKIVQFERPVLRLSRPVVGELLRFNAFGEDVSPASTFDLNVWEVLGDALALGNDELVQWLVNNYNAGRHLDDPEKRQIIMGLAAQVGNMALFKQLLDEGVDVPEWALEEAAGNGHLEMVDELLKYPWDGRPMGKAGAGGHLEVIKRLIGEGDEAFAALEEASGRGHLEVVRWIVENHPDQLPESDALAQAAENGHVKMVEFLLGYSTPREIDMENAARGGNLDIIRAYLQHGARITSSALEQAVDNGHLEALQFLLANQ